MAKLQCYLSLVLMSCAGIFTRLEAHYPKEQESDSAELRLISTVFRHGDRTMDPTVGEFYPTDPNNNFNYYPYGKGQLTNEGKRRAYQFGRMLKQRYNNFLGDIYYQPNIHARSTELTRTKMTLQLVLAGLYPPPRIQRWNLNLMWQPVNIQYNANITKDGLLFPYNCPTYQQKLLKVSQTPKAIAEEKQFDDLKEEMTKYTGKNITSLTGLFGLYHTLYTEYYLGLPLPEWTQKVFPYGRLYDASILQYNMLSYNDELTKLNGGVLLHRMIQDMKEVINGTSVDKKINLFSAHDLNVIAMLQALGVYNNIFPSFSSAVIIELLEKKGNYFVKVLYYLGIPAEIVELQIPGCDVMCPFNKFVNLRLAATAPDEEDPNCPRNLPDSPFKF
ncbi:venom acid phosphatase Acph-1-like [Odontomachus brunneus]|uniref:venom acid phosphatase Acph-1-like n=1 Tax=Odontomachus brunneus TaxID=486640 RepID=UPI0013F2A032|nr:venom acid phosphatase Acph-1-like [Odontomachus brunneus]